MSRKSKNGRFALRRSGERVNKGVTEEKRPVKKRIIKEVKEEVPESKKSIVPIKEDEVETRDCGLSGEEIGLLGSIQEVIGKNKEIGSKLVVEDPTKSETTTKEVGNRGRSIILSEVEGGTVIEITPSSKYGIFEEVVSRTKGLNVKFVRISNWGMQSKLFRKEIEGVYLKENKYGLKTVPYLHIIRDKKVFEVNVCSEVVHIWNASYFVIVEALRGNIREEIRKIILMRTSLIIK